MVMTTTNEVTITAAEVDELHRKANESTQRAHEDLVAYRLAQWQLTELRRSGKV